jgi:hypothetical protein
MWRSRATPSSSGRACWAAEAASGATRSSHSAWSHRARRSPGERRPSQRGCPGA